MYRAVVAARFDRGALEQARVSRDRVHMYSVRLQELTAATANRYGSVSQQPFSDGAVAVFENADAAVQFGLRLIDDWRELLSGSGDQTILASLTNAQAVGLRVACQFGECAQLAERGMWQGRAVDLACGSVGLADPDTLFVSEAILDLVDAPLHEYREAGVYNVEGDRAGDRSMFRILEYRTDAYSTRSPEEMSADDWLLRAASLAGTQEENTDTEIACYQEALRLNPELPTAYNNMAVFLSARNEISAATGHYQTAISLRPDYPEAHYNYAVLLDRRGSLTGAGEHFSTAQKYRPGYVDAHFAFASLLHRTDRVKEAEVHYAESLSLNPEHREALNNFAVLLEDMGRMVEASERYRSALQIEPGHPETHYNYALLLEKQGDVAAAETNYRAAIALRPDYVEAHNNLAVLLQISGNTDAAATHYAETLRLRPDEPEAHYNYGLLLQSIGHPDAESHLSLARDLVPDAHDAVGSTPGAVRGDFDIALTRREMDVLRLIAVGRSNRDIAEELSISPSTVAHHVTSILEKTGAENRTQAAALAARAGIVVR